MKVAVSIPDVVYEQGERLALRLKLPRSRLEARIITRAGARTVLKHTEW